MQTPIMPRSKHYDASVDQAIASAVRTLKDDRDIDATTLSAYAGIALSSLNKKLKGDTTWTASDVAALAKYFGVTPNDLFSGRPIGTAGEEG